MNPVATHNLIVNEIQRLEQEYAQTKEAAHVDAVATRRMVFHLPERCVQIEREVARLRRVKGIRRGTSMQAHGRRNTRA